MRNHLSKYKLLYLALGGIIFIILSLLVFNKNHNDLWAFPFARGREIAILKTVITADQEKSEHYYRLYENGSKVEIEPSERDTNQLHSFVHPDDLHSYFIDVKEIHAIPIERNENGYPTKYTYEDENWNSYEEVPVTTNQQLRAVEDDFFQQLKQFKRHFFTYFYDGDTIFVDATHDCGISSEEFIYAYDIPTQALRRISKLREHEKIVWIYQQ